jgi:hypothetical protein
MHPEDIEGLGGPTEGERKVFRFLLEAARPDQDFIGWYEPTIGEQGKEPDFVLFGKQQGLRVLEVKDWVIDQIEEADPRTPCAFANDFHNWGEGLPKITK